MPSQQDLGYGPGVRPPDYAGKSIDVWVGDDKIVEVEAPDGTVVEFPAGTSPEVMRNVMAQQFGGPSPSQMRANADADARAAGTPDFVRSFNQGVALNFADEIDAYGAKLETMIANAGRRVMGKDIPYTSDEAKQAVLGAEQRAMERFAGEHPWVNGGLQLAGGLATPGAGVAGKFIGEGVGLGARALRSAGVGAAYGAAAGAGVSDGNMIDRAGGAGQGALLGGLTGGAVPVVASGIGNTIRAANAATGNRLISPERRAAERLAELLAKDDLTDIPAAAAKWRSVGGSDPVLMDLAGENTRAALRAASSLPGDARNRSVSYLEALVANLQDNAINRTRELTPDVRTIPEVERGIAGRIEAATTPPDVNYGAAGSQASVRLNESRDAANQWVNEAYAAAREAAPEAAHFQSDAFPQIKANIREAVRDFHPDDVPSVARELNALDLLSTPTVRDLYEARQRLTSVRLSDPKQAAAAGMAVRQIDRELSDAVERGIVAGDPAVVGYWQTAIGRRRAFGQLWEGGDLIDRLTAREWRGGANVQSVAPEDASRALFGSGSGLNVGPNLTRDFARLRDRLGPTSPEWRAIQNEAFGRVMARDAGRETYGQAWEAFARQNPELAPMLMSADGQAGMEASQRALATALAERRALEAGQGVMSTAPDVLADTLSRLDAGNASVAQVGAARTLEDMIGRPGEGATGLLNRLSSGTNAGRNLETMFGEDAASSYQRALAQELDRVSNARFVSPNTGAQTEPRASDKGFFGEMRAKAGTAFTKLLQGATLTDADRAELVAMGLMSPEEAAQRLAPRPNRTREVTQQASGPVAALITALSAQ